MKFMIIGYTRTGKKESGQDLQLEALRKAGCQKLFYDTANHQPELVNMINTLQEGDQVVVLSIDRLGRTTYDLIRLLLEWKQRGIGFRSLAEGIDTTVKVGRLWYSFITALAENDKQIKAERTLAGIRESRSRGRMGGRPRGLTKKAKQAASIAATLYQSKKFTTDQICEQLKIGSKATLYNYLRHEGIQVKGWIKKSKTSSV